MTIALKISITTCYTDPNSTIGNPKASAALEMDEEQLVVDINQNYQRTRLPIPKRGGSLYRLSTTFSTTFFRIRKVMRLALCIFAIVTAARAQTLVEKTYEGWTCPNTPRLELSPSSEHWLEGSIGTSPVRMYLRRGGETVVDVFYYCTPQAWGDSFILGGRWKGGGTIEAREIGEDTEFGIFLPAFEAMEIKADIGRLEGRLTDSGFIGVWTPEHDSENQAVRLKTVPRPDCDGNGPWKRFNDIRWPVSFWYPASWLVKVTHERVALTCPDPSRMAFENLGIFLTQGKGADPEQIDFVQCGDQWQTGRLFHECTCEKPSDCKAATVINQDGITILGGNEIEWRVYCRDGPYVGQGNGDRRVLLIDDTWIEFLGDGYSELMERILPTVERRR